MEPERPTYSEKRRSAGKGLSDGGGGEYPAAANGETGAAQCHVQYNS